MAEGTADDGDDETTQPTAEGDLGDAVDEAMKSEIKRQRARFIQQIVGLDRVEGVGRSEERWDETFYRNLGLGRPDDPAV